VCRSPMAAAVVHSAVYAKYERGLEAAVPLSLVVVVVLRSTSTLLT
jgi:hypothetical protein